MWEFIKKIALTNTASKSKIDYEHLKNIWIKDIKRIKLIINSSSEKLGKSCMSTQHFTNKLFASSFRLQFMNTLSTSNKHIVYNFL